jgi:hypothetical protein
LPESGDSWYKSRQLKRGFDGTWQGECLGKLAGAYTHVGKLPIARKVFYTLNPKPYLKP